MNDSVLLEQEVKIRAFVISDFRTKIKLHTLPRYGLSQAEDREDRRKDGDAWEFKRVGG